ncbi:MAG: hypothetical protein ACREF4_14930, partial [Gammaproteobacteria bacterium]
VTGDGNPGALTTVIGNAKRKDGIKLKNCHYFTIDGFAVRRSAYKGIYVDGTSDGSRAERVLVRNCETQENRKQGIFFRYTTDGSTRISQGCDRVVIETARGGCARDARAPRES